MLNPDTDIGVLLVFNITKADQRYFADKEWINGYYTFSFQDFYDEENNDFGNLLVFNEETLSPGKGFNVHPTHDMIIITYIIEGNLKHYDDAINEEIIVGTGEFQIMHAGDGINHSEKNASKDKSLSYLQFWFTSKADNNKPDYKKIVFSHELTSNKLFKVFAEDDGLGNIRQDVDFYMSSLGKDEIIEYIPDIGRQNFIFLLEGELDINEKVLSARDSVRIKNQTSLIIKATRNSIFFFIDTI